MEGVFVQNPKVAVAFCNVDPAEHDPAQGFIPTFHCAEEKMTTSVGQKRGGIGAGMAGRQSIILELGGFDEMLGAGARFPSCEENDLATRALLKGHHVLETNRTSVLHYGFRSWSEGRLLAQRDCLGSGAACAKHVKGRGLPMAAVPLRVLWRFTGLMFRESIRSKRPRGLKRITAFVSGFVQGWRTPIIRETLVFRSKSN
jgi:hypothetical protein